MFTKLFTAKHQKNRKSRRNLIRRRMFRPEHLEDRRLLAAFQGLGDLAGGAFFSDAHGISDDGQVVVGESIGTSGERYPFRWSTSEGMVTLETDFLPAGVARAASADGSGVVGTLYDPSTDYVAAVQWESDVLTRIADPNSSTWDISSDGQFIVGQQQAAGEPREAHLWNAVTGVATPLGTLISGGSSEARAVSNDGKFVTGEAANADSGRDVFLWSAGGMTSLGITGSGHDISADGSVVVGWEDVVTKSRNGRIRDIYLEAFRWTNGGKVSLGDLPGGDYQSLAYAVSGDGTVIAGSSSSDKGDEAFVWTKNATEDTGVMRSLQEILSVDHGLDLTGWQLQGVRDVSADGTTFVGVGINPDGNREAFIASLGPPAPGVSVTPSAGLVTSETGDTATFNVVLNTQPAANVAIPLSSSDLAEGTIAITELIFTPANWDVPQTVTVTGEDDFVQDGDITYSIITGPTSSTDLDYNGLSVADVSLTNTDNEVPAAEALYVYDIRFDSRRGGNDWRAVFEIRSDSDGDGLGAAADEVRAGVTITVVFAGQTFTGTTDADGVFRTDWIQKLSSGSYYAQAVDLALTGYAWDPLAMDLEDDSDGDGNPDEVLIV